MHGFSGPLGLKWGFGGQNMGRVGVILTSNELVLPFGSSHVCANFGENRSRNATARVPPDGQIHTLTDTDRFIICHMLYAVAMGQIKITATAVSSATHTCLEGKYARLMHCVCY